MHWTALGEKFKPPLELQLAIHTGQLTPHLPFTPMCSLIQFVTFRTLILLLFFPKSFLPLI